MVRVAVLGANGQVGAEVCLLLSKSPSLELVPICRNRSGSAFLRSQGLACRHGRPAQADDARRLFGDCDVIVNFALATGNPAQIRHIEDQLVRNACLHSKPDTVIVHFSTQTVYGDPAPGRWIRWLSPYGRTKLATERTVRAAASRGRKRAYILRLGHVCGELQSISHNMRNDLLHGLAVLPPIDVPSNTVLTVVIADALHRILAGGVPPGTYDLMNTPQWTWKEVYAYEAKRCGAAQPPRLSTQGPRPSGRLAIRRWVGLLSGLAANRFTREAVAKILAFAPEETSRRLQAVWYCRRARAEIAALSHRTEPALAEHLSWVQNGKAPFPQPATLELLRNSPYDGLVQPRGSRWPLDLPDAAEGAAPSVMPARTLTD